MRPGEASLGTGATPGAGLSTAVTSCPGLRGSRATPDEGPGLLTRKKSLYESSSIALLISSSQNPVIPDLACVDFQ